MNRSGPIIIMEDDKDDREVLQEVFTNLKCPNQILFFTDGQSALDFLNKTDVIPFLILSDVNMPKLDGFALRDKIRQDAELQVRCIPYLFFTTAVNQHAVIEAYSMSVQGFFVKPSKMAELERTIRAILDYWALCASPNNFKLDAR